MSFLTTYILTWRLAVALPIALLAYFPLRTAFRKLRIGDMDLLDNGAVEQSFWASFWVGIAAIIYSYVAVLILVVWMCLMRRHLMTARAWMASFLAIAICSFWYYVLYYLVPMINL